MGLITVILGPIMGHQGPKGNLNSRDFFRSFRNIQDGKRFRHQTVLKIMFARARV